MFLNANIKTVYPDFGLSCWGWIFFCVCFTPIVAGYPRWLCGEQPCFRANAPDPSCPQEQAQLSCQKSFLLSQQCLAPAGSFAWSQETLIPSQILHPFCSSLTSNTHCMTPSRVSEVLPVLVLPCYITHHRMGRSHFPGSARFPEGEHSFCWEHQCLSVHIP